MNSRHFASFFIGVFLCSVLLPPTEAGHKIKVKKLIKALLLARALSPKKIPLPLPLPLPIPIFQENIKHVPYE